MVSGETPAAAAESLHANPCAMRSTSERSAGVRLVPSMNLAENGERISISICGIFFPYPVNQGFLGYCPVHDRRGGAPPLGRPYDRDVSHAPPGCHLLHARFTRVVPVDTPSDERRTLPLDLAPPIGP